MRPTPAGQPAADQTIVVPGAGRVTVEPDVADVRLGVALSRPTAAQARDAAAVTMTAILAALDGAGVERRDVRTSLLSLGPEYDHSGGRARQTGYQLSNVLSVTVRDLPAVGRVIDAALAAGATSMDSLAFRRADPSESEAAARRAAVDDARRRAETLADAAGIRVGDVVGIVEGGPPPAGPLPRFKMAEMAMADAGTPVESGTLEIDCSIVVAFGIEPSSGDGSAPARSQRRSPTTR